MSLAVTPSSGFRLKNGALPHTNKIAQSAGWQAAPCELPARDEFSARLPFGPIGILAE